MKRDSKRFSELNDRDNQKSEDSRKSNKMRLSRLNEILTGEIISKEKEFTKEIHYVF